MTTELFVRASDRSARMRVPIGSPIIGDFVVVGLYNLVLNCQRAGTTYFPVDRFRLKGLPFPGTIFEVLVFAMPKYEERAALYFFGLNFFLEVFMSISYYTASLEGSPKCERRAASNFAGLKFRSFPTVFGLGCAGLDATGFATGFAVALGATLAGAFATGFAGAFFVATGAFAGALAAGAGFDFFMYLARHSGDPNASFFGALLMMFFCYRDRSMIVSLFRILPR